MSQVEPSVARRLLQGMQGPRPTGESEVEPTAPGWQTDRVAKKRDPRFGMVRRQSGG